MYSTFENLQELLEEVRRDKRLSGSGAFSANRYPVRFVLFDNFRDSFDFVSAMQSDFNCSFQSVNDWMDNEYPDVMLTHTKLSEQIESFVREHSLQDYVITPFSELARFYDNQHYKEFDAVVKTVKAIESSKAGFENHQRVYIPIVGLEGKMSKFSSDSQIFIWYFKNVDKQFNYKLILTDNSLYNVSNLTEKFTVVNDIQEWLSVWRNQNAKNKIISTSKALFANAEYAQPDNAFSFCVCNNSYEFLTQGLGLNLSAVEFKDGDLPHWDRLASEIIIDSFSFDQFFNKYFQIHDLSDYSVFIDTWFKCKNEFERWLLSNYYTYRFCNKGYICQVLKHINNYVDRDFFAEIALQIFEQNNLEENRKERAACMKAASEHNVQLADHHQSMLAEYLSNLALTQNHATAISFFTCLTNAEKKLALKWLADGKIKKDDILSFFPDLYHYLGPNLSNRPTWFFEYIDLYKFAKLNNQYLDSVAQIISQKNASEVSFNSWYNEFKTTKTCLENRQDIEVFYWIDGLGIEWIPFVKYLIEQKASNGIYLNDVKIARALYPTTTSNNKPSLLDLSSELKKVGDLDSHAHKPTNSYPDYILEEFEIVKNAIDEITTKYNGKKIAIVSDHGITALSQLCNGLNLAGFTSDHHGRLAERTTGECVSGNEYIICEDKKTVCALQHQSICAKTPTMQSVHGGCTPEEILVPIFIISSHKETDNWTAVLLTRELSTNPKLKYKISGLSALDTPYVLYNGRRYDLNTTDGIMYESELLSLDEARDFVELVVCDKIQKDNVKVKTGVEEDDILSF